MPKSPRLQSELKGGKVQLRLKPAQKDLIARAARVKQTTLTGFMVEHAFGAAQQILADQVNFALSPERWEAFRAALDAPPKDIPALRKLLTGPDLFHDDKTAAL
jgi:uncharacterized protein (DUF1778 family)